MTTGGRAWSQAAGARDATRDGNTTGNGEELGDELDPATSLNSEVGGSGLEYRISSINTGHIVPVIDAAKEVIDNTDKEELAKFFGLKNDLEDDEAEVPNTVCISPHKIQGIGAGFVPVYWKSIFSTKSFKYQVKMLYKLQSNLCIKKAFLWEYLLEEQQLLP